jgi:hypothetical protein
VDLSESDNRLHLLYWPLPNQEAVNRYQAVMCCQAFSHDASNLTCTSQQRDSVQCNNGEGYAYCPGPADPDSDRLHHFLDAHQV